jgi:hypothetical protein
VELTDTQSLFRYGELHIIFSKVNKRGCVIRAVPKGIPVRLICFAVKFIRVHDIQNLARTVAGGNFSELTGDDGAGDFIPVPRISAVEVGFAKYDQNTTLPIRKKNRRRGEQRRVFETRNLCRR